MICPKCKEKLLNIDNTYKCLNNHSFDISKTGYTNLILNYNNSGDNKEMIQARHRIMNMNYFDLLSKKISEILKNLNVNSILDAGCGEGYYTRVIANTLDVPIYGIDISKNACLQASKDNKKVKYFVASIYDMPFSDHEIDAIINIFAPHCETEFARVANKYLIVIIPAANHLIEVKNKLYDNVYLNSKDSLDFCGFNLKEKVHLTYQKDVVNIMDLIKMTPYFYKTKNPNLTISNLLTTFDFEILVYERVL